MVWSSLYCYGALEPICLCEYVSYPYRITSPMLTDMSLVHLLKLVKLIRVRLL